MKKKNKIITLTEREREKLEGKNLKQLDRRIKLKGQRMIEQTYLTMLIIIVTKIVYKFAATE